MAVISNAKTYKEDHANLNNWVDNGYHASMDWIKNRLIEDGHNVV